MKTTIRNTKNLSQPIDFHGIGTGKCLGSDIDFTFEDNTNLILSEIKWRGTKLTMGQQILLTRLADAWEASSPKRRAFVIFATHNEVDAEQPVMLKDCDVQSVYRNGKWNKYSSSFGDLVKSLAVKYNITKLAS